MHLLKVPARPKMTPFPDLLNGPIEYDEWRPFFNVIDFSYWNVELEK